MSDSEIPQRAVHQAPLSMGFPRQEYQSGVPLPSPEHLLNEYELNDRTLLKVQLEKHKNIRISYKPFPRYSKCFSSASRHKSKVSPLLEPNDSNIDSPETLVDIKTGNTFLDNNDKSLAQTYICKKSALTHSPPRQRISELLALQYKSLKPMVSLPFQF